MTLISLDELARDPSRASDLPAAERTRLVLACSAILAALATSPNGDGAMPVPAKQATLPAPLEIDRCLTVPEAASLLGFKTSYVYEMIRRREFLAIRRGKYIRVRHATLVEWIAKKEKA
jgi:excisionase family DNA binding protein